MSQDSAHHAATPPLSIRAQSASGSVIRELLKLAARPQVISFAGGLPAPESFPVAALAAACEQVLAAEGSRALQYSITDGELALREQIAARETAQGVPTSADEVLIVSGSQQGLDLIARAFIDEGSTVLVESPTYLGALQAFRLQAPRFVELPVDEEGLAPLAIGAAARGARFAYVMPTFQNPTGRTLSAERRAQLAQRARELDLWLVEDDPYGELWYESAPPASLRAHAPERTLKLGTLSKVLAPGLRLGYVVGPSAALEVLCRLKQAMDLHTSTFTQRVAARVLADNLLERHLPAVRQRYATHCQAMIEAMTEHFPASCRWTRPAGGMFIWVELPADVDAEILLQDAIDQDVAFVPGSAFYADTPKTNTLRLSFVTVDPERIRQGIARLGRLLHQRA
ncbi:MAG: PLP-dependent aminotransferase family protein [Burkholderiaceae bacterium]